MLIAVLRKYTRDFGSELKIYVKLTKFSVDWKNLSILRLNFEISVCYKNRIVYNKTIFLKIYIFLEPRENFWSVPQTTR